MMLLWLLAGVIAVSLAYLLPANAIDPWNPLNTAGIVVAVYVIALTAYSLRRPFPPRVRNGILVIAVFVGGALLVAWRGFDDQAHYQADTLSKVRGTISRGVIASELSEPLLEALRVYHAQPSGKRKSIGKVFEVLHPGVVVGKDLHQQTSTSDRLRILIESMNDSEVFLVAEEGYVKGDDESFRNRSGNIGMIQETARLTERGISYEREN